MDLVRYEVISTEQDDWELPPFPEKYAKNITPETYPDYIGRVGMYAGSAILVRGYQEIGIALRFDDGETVGFKPWMLRRL